MHFYVDSCTQLLYIQYMTTTHDIKVSGNNIRRKVTASGFTKEQVVAHVQYKGFRFSLAGLDRIYRGELPMTDTNEILEAIAEKCSCSTADFAESELEAS